MTHTNELEIKLYQLLKEDNWSDDAATQAVHAVKGLQKDAIKELPTKVDLANLKVDLIKWTIATGLTVVGLLTAIFFGITRYFT